MQAAPAPLRPSLHEYLQHRQSTYPTVVQAPVTQLIANISAFSDQPVREPVAADTPYGALAAAIEGLNHRENLALALGRLASSSVASTALGCLLGAWGGLSILPIPWMYLLSADSRQGITQLAENFYRHWAGLGVHGSTYEVLPLDL